MDSREAIARSNSAEVDKVIQRIELISNQLLLRKEWDAAVSKIVWEWCSISEYPLLVLYIDGNTLKASSTVPTTSGDVNLLYFIRKPNHEVTLRDFDNVVTFGKLTGQVDEILFALMEHIYMPGFFDTVNTIGDTRNTELCLTYQKFLGFITELQSEQLGIPILYVPSRQAGFDLLVEGGHHSQITIMLDNLGFLWIDVIRQHLRVPKPLNTNKTHQLIGEYEFYLGRYETLCALQLQLQRKEVVLLLDRLNAHNPYLVHQINQLAAEIGIRCDEVKNNSRFLSLLLAPCNEFDKSEVLEVFPAHLVHIIQMIKFIWSRSAHLNSVQHVVDLLRMLSNQLMANCQKQINTLDIMDYRSKNGLQLAKVAVDCCTYYKEIFAQIFQNDNVDMQYIADRVFGQIDEFIKRLHDLIEVCEFDVIYKKATHGNHHNTEYNLNSDEAPGIVAIFNRKYQNIRLTFVKIHNEVRASSAAMLNIHNREWDAAFKQFASSMDLLDQMVLDLINHLFETQMNIEEAIDALFLMYDFSPRNAIRPVYMKKVVHVWQLYSCDLSQTNVRMQKEGSVHLNCIPKYAYKSLLLNINSERIQWLTKLFDMAEWLPEIPKKSIDARHEFIADGIKSNTTQSFVDWKMQVTGDNLKAITKRSLMKKFGARNEYFQCNVDNYVFTVCAEAHYFEFMQYHVPPSVKQIHARADVIKVVHGKVMKIVCDYNRMQKSLTTADRKLFQMFLQEANRIIMPGILRVTWDDEAVEPFIRECSNKCEQIGMTLKLYRTIHSFMQKYCEEIANTIVCRIDERCWESMESIIAQLNDHQRVAKQSFTYIFKDGFVQMIDAVSYEFKKHAHRIRNAWSSYISKIDSLLEQSFKLSIDKSLEQLYSMLHGTHFEPSSLFIIHASVIEERLTLKPSLDDILSFLQSISTIPINAVRDFSRLTGKYVATAEPMPPFYKSIEANPSYQNNIAHIVGEIDIIRGHVNQWLESWQKIMHSTKRTQNEFDRMFANDDLQSSAIKKLIDEYNDQLETIVANQTQTKAHFLIIKAGDVKVTLRRNITQLKAAALMQLKTLSGAKLANIYEYMLENTQSLAKEPTNPDEIEHSLMLFQKLADEAEDVASKFPELYAYFNILDKNSITIESDERAKLAELEMRWTTYLDQFDQIGAMVEEARLKVKDGLLRDKAQLDADVMKLIELFEHLPTTSSTEVANALADIDNMHDRLRALCQREEEIFRQLKQIHASANRNDNLLELQTRLSLLKNIWRIADQWERASLNYRLSKISSADTVEMENFAEDMIASIGAVAKEVRGRDWDILVVMQKRLSEFNRTLPLLKALRNTAMRLRHWEQIKTTVNRNFDESSDDFNLGAIIEMQFQVHYDKITDVSQAATMELQIEGHLKSIENIWNAMTIEFFPLQEDLLRIVHADACFVTLEDNLLQILTMKSARYGEPFMDRIDFWAKTLNNIQETVEMALSVQQLWIYLRNIFQGDDIRKQLPEENARLIESTEQWRHLTQLMAKGSNIIKSTHCIRPNYLLENFAKLREKLEAIQRALEVYLERKRQNFPRFYFISDDDLLDVLGNAAKPELIQKHFHKVFDNIENCDMKCVDARRAVKWEIHGMHSDDGESVKFLDAVRVIGPAESWLRDIETAMRRVLKAKILACIKDLLEHSDPTSVENWLHKWPAQLCLTATKVQWTLNCTKTLKLCKQLDSSKPHRKLYKRQCAILAVLSDLSRRDLAKQMRLKVNSTITIQLHGRDVIQRLHRFNCQSVSHFEWFSQLRFYWDRAHGDCAIRQTNTLNWYNYEYIGNSGRLIITPLTDRCFITLTTALHMCFGGSPKGPAG